MRALIFITILLSCNKTIKELVTKNKIGNEYWEHIKKDEDEELKEFLEKEENRNINLNTLRNEEGEIALTLAAKHNSLEVIKLLIVRERIDINAINEKGETALVVSILRAEESIDRDEIIDKLLDKGADVNLRYGLNGNNLLMVSILIGDSFIVNKILRYKVNINAQNLDGETALMLAIKSEDKDLIAPLLKHKNININLKNNQGKTLLAYAVENNSAVVKLLLDEDGIEINTIDKEGKTLLDYLNFENFKIELVVALIKKGAIVNNKNYFYSEARKHHLEEIISLLIENNGKLSYEKDGNNLLHWSILLFNKNMEISLKLTIYLMREMKIDPNLIKNYVRYAKQRNIDIFYLMEILYEEEAGHYLKENIMKLKNKEKKTIDLIFKAAKSSNTTILENLLKKHPDINIKDPFDNTLLIIAVGKEDKNMTKLLINSGIDINYRNKEGDTALIVATRKGNKGIAKLLLEKGADIHEKAEDGFTPLIIAIIKYPEILKLFIKSVANFKKEDNERKTPLIIAAIYNNKTSASLILKAGVDINAKDIYGWSALMYAIIYSFKDMAEFLIEKGAKVNDRNNRGDPPLFIISYGYLTSYTLKSNGVVISKIHVPLCSYKGHTELIVETTDRIPTPFSNYGYVDEKILSSLIKKEANENSEIEKAMNIATKFKNKKVIDTLREHSTFHSHCSDETYNSNKMKLFSSVDQLENENNSEALIDAVLEMNENKVRLLIEKGIDLNYTDGEERTALMYSIEFGYEEIAKLLIEKMSSECKDYNNNKEKALILAIEYTRKEIIKLLIKAGADVNYEDNERGTPLQIATFLQNIEIMKLLIKSGAKINYKDKSGSSLLIYSISGKNKEVVKFLIEKGANITEKDIDGQNALLFAIEHGNKDIAKIIIKEEVKILYNNNFEVALVLKAKKIAKERNYTKVCIYIIEEIIKNEKGSKPNKRVELLKELIELPLELFNHIMSFL